jgi:hypothetical protein
MESTQHVAFYQQSYSYLFFSYAIAIVIERKEKKITL